MSSSPARAETPIATGLSLPVGRVRRILEEDCFVVLALAFTLAAVAVAAPASMIVPDTWLALVDGRWIAQHGLPHTDHLAVWTAGVS